MNTGIERIHIECSRFPVNMCLIPITKARQIYDMCQTKMPSHSDDTSSVTKNNLIYINSEWKPITFTHVEYPIGTSFHKLLHCPQSGGIRGI